MKNTLLRQRAIALVALTALAVLAVFTLTGHPLIAPDTLAGLGLLPMAIGNTTIDDITRAIHEQHTAVDQFIARHDERLKNVESRLGDVLKKANRPPSGTDSDSFDTVEDTEHRKAFDAFLRRGDDADLPAMQRKAMQTGSDPDGGVLVPVDLDRAIDRIAPTMSAMYRLADVVTTGSAKWEKLVKTSGMTMRRVADGQTGGESTAPKFAKISIDIFTAEVEPWVYNETLEDSFIDLAADLSEEAAIGFAEGAGAEFITGDGVGKARGILSYDTVENASYAWGSVGYIVSGKSAALASVAPADALLNLVAALPTKYRQGASFLMNDATLNVIRQVKDGSGQYYLWQPDPAAPFGGKLLGHKIEVDDNMPDIGAGSYSIAFGDFKRAYAIVNRNGISVIRDNITSKGTTKFNFRRRFGGGIKHYEAIKLMRFATS